MNKEKETVTVTIPKKEYEYFKDINKKIENCLEEIERIGLIDKDKPNINKYVKVTKPTSLGKIDPDIVNKVNLYCSLTGMKRTEFITNLIIKELNDKVLDNSTMLLNELWYFNLNDLLKKKKIEATTETPISDFKNQMVIFRISNNLDKWNNIINSYATDITKHRGIMPFILPAKIREDKLEGIKLYFIIFNYLNTVHIENLDEKKLELGLIEFDELKYVLGSNNNKKLLADYKNLQELIKKVNEKNIQNEEEIVYQLLKNNCIMSLEQALYSNNNNSYSELCFIGGLNTYFKEKPSESITDNIFKEIYDY